MRMKGNVIDRVASVLLVLITLAVAGHYFSRASSRGPSSEALATSEDAPVDNWREFTSDALLVAGAENGDRVLIEFMDFQCPFCQRLAHGAAQEAAAAGWTVLLLHYPLSNHRFALAASVAAECADRQGRFPEMYGALFQSPELFGIKPWSEYGAEAGIIDMPAFEACLEEPESSFPRISRGRQLGEALGIRGTPTVIANGLKLGRPPSSLGDILAALQLDESKPVEGESTSESAESARGLGVTHSASAHEVHDSSGVWIVENWNPAWQAASRWTIDPSPLLQIGARDGEGPYLLTTVTSATRTMDGAIILVEGQSREIRVFDDRGRHLTSMGGPGPGPGEFRSPPDLAMLMGDTVLAFDFLARRYSWFTLDGNLIRDAPLRPEASLANLEGVGPGVGPGIRRGGGGAHGRVLFQDSSFLTIGTFPSSARWIQPSGGVAALPDVVDHNDFRLGIIGFEGKREVVIGRFPSVEGGYVGGRGLPAVTVNNPLYAPAYYAAVSPLRRVHVATPGQREIRTYNAHGQLIRIVRQHASLKPVTRRLHETLRSQLRSDASERGADADAALDLFEQLTFPDSIFPYAGLEVDLEGNLWARNHSFLDAESQPTYTVFDHKGIWLGIVPVPFEATDQGRPRFLEIGPDYVLAEWRDELSVPYVRVHRLMRQ